MADIRHRRVLGSSDRWPREVVRLLSCPIIVPQRDTIQQHGVCRIHDRSGLFQKLADCDRNVRDGKLKHECKLLSRRALNVAKPFRLFHLAIISETWLTMF